MKKSVKETNLGEKEYFYHCNAFHASAQNQNQAWYFLLFSICHV